MSQEDIQATDTQEQEQTFESIEEAVFGSDSGSNVESAFTENTGNQEEAAPEGTPAPEQEVSSDNDEKRYQYWQSQADKLKNENQILRNNMITAERLKTPAQPQPGPEPYQMTGQEQVEDFPPPPEKPVAPRNFSREEAYSDPASESARYLDEVEEWRDNTVEYNTLKTQYDQAVMNEKFAAMENERIENAKRAQAQQQAIAQQRQVKEAVMGHYGMDEREAVDFMNTMSNPQSINIDNLVKLYRMNQGQNMDTQNAPAQPSDAFKQVQNAQQVPSPMGVMPSGNANQDGRSFEDKVMDSLIGNYESKNPWK